MEILGPVFSGDEIMTAVDKQCRNAQAEHYPIRHIRKWSAALHPPSENHEEYAQQTAADIKSQIEELLNKLYERFHKHKLPR